MLVHFTIDAGTVPVTEQARPDAFRQYLRMLHEYDSNAENRARNTIRQHLATNTTFNAKQIACTGERDTWRAEFESLYDAMRNEGLLQTMLMTKPASS